MLGTIPLLLGFSWVGSSFAWLSWQSIGLLGLSLALLIVHSVRQKRLGREPVIEPDLFRTSLRIFSVSLLVTCLINVALIGGTYFLPLFLQEVVGVTATLSGLTLMPMMITAIGGSVLGGLLSSLTGRYKWIALLGSASMIAGLLLMLRFDIHTSNQEPLVALLVFGIGTGAGQTMFTLALQNAMPERIGSLVLMLLAFAVSCFLKELPLRECKHRGA